jgi:hypothetical protein
VLPRGQKLPAGHSAQLATEVAPVPPLYVPSGQGYCVEYCTAPGQMYPVGQVPRKPLAYTSVAPEAHQSPGGQRKHEVASEVPALTLPYVPAGQKVIA